jgi:hypothetical protein
MMWLKAARPLLPLAALLASSGAFAIKVPTGSDDLNLNINVLLQVRAEGSWDGPPTTPTSTEGASPNGTFNSDYYLRRARLIATGSAYEYFIFNIMLDTPFFGRRGNFGGSTFVQDLAVGFVPVKDIIIEAGFLFMPFSHQSPAAGSSGNGLEGLGTVLTNLYNNQRGLRETGVQVRALVLDRWILIRGGVYEGARATTAAPTINPNGRPLVGGMLRLNLVGDETAYAYPGIYMDGKSRVSIGVGGQFQSKGSNIPVTTVSATGSRTTTSAGIDDYRAYSADTFVDLALPGDTEFVLQATGFRFNWGKGSDKTGYGAAGELGYRWHGIEPQTNFYWFNSDSRQNSFLRVAGGLNFFLKGPQARLSTEFVSVINSGNLNTTPALHQVLLQAQVSF